MFKRILIANRGEIALRIIRACQEMGIETVAVYSDADAESLPVQYADHKVHIGRSISKKSYLNQEVLVKAAIDSGADAVHPGYGFLSENATFAKACIDNGIAFIGPTPETIAMAGNKSEARKKLLPLGIPLISGSDDVLRSEEEALALAEKIGYPIIIKASGGGGGRGMRIARTPEEVRDGFKMASGEAKAAFGAPDVYMEKYIELPRHVEIQILADTHGNCLYLGERECSIQKRYQKLIEESPSPLVDEEMRKKMGETAVRIARAMDYVSAGTVEFLVDKNKNFYFMEVNSRVQVEHPVTEFVTGIDIIREQIRISAGEKLMMTQDDIKLNGWSIECRINAEDPDHNFMPSPGIIEKLILPGGLGVRNETHIFQGYEVPPFYDSLICKLVVWAEDRNRAIMRMQRALKEFHVEGIKVTVPFHQKVFADPQFVAGDINTHYLEKFEKKPE